MRIFTNTAISREIEIFRETCTQSSTGTSLCCVDFIGLYVFVYGFRGFILFL